jgi:hypothetical protein
VPVTDEHVAALRAQLAGNHEEHKQLLRELDAAGSMHDYMGLISAAFLEAVDRRFKDATLPAAVIEWISDVRAQSDAASQAINPSIAERVILKALGHGEITDISGTDVRQVMRVLLPILIADEHLSDADLDGFLTAARKLA